jgi:hypothetical protein
MHRAVIVGLEPCRLKSPLGLGQGRRTAFFRSFQESRQGRVGGVCGHDRRRDEQERREAPNTDWAPIHDRPSDESEVTNANARHSSPLEPGVQSQFPRLRPGSIAQSILVQQLFAALRQTGQLLGQ